MLLEQRPRDVQIARLGLVRVADHPSQKHLRSPRNGREARPDEATGTGLCHRQVGPALAQALQHDPGEVGVTLAVVVGAEGRDEEVARPTQLDLGLGLGQGPCSEPEVHPDPLGQIGQCDGAESRFQLRQRVLKS